MCVRVERNRVGGWFFYFPVRTPSPVTFLDKYPPGWNMRGTFFIDVMRVWPLIYSRQNSPKGKVFQYWKLHENVFIFFIFYLKIDRFSRKPMLSQKIRKTYVFPGKHRFSGGHSFADRKHRFSDRKHMFSLSKTTFSEKPMFSRENIGNSISSPKSFRNICFLSENLL